MLQVTINEYLAELKLTNRKHILVEGKTDKIAIEKLLAHYFELRKQRLDNQGIEIDLAERISESQHTMPNRAKVEEVASRAAGTPSETKLVGFVDREFREFEWTNGINDLLQQHKIIGRLIWSRGHSAENYFFDVSVLCGVFTHLAVAHNDEALSLFERLLHETLKLGAAISLAAMEIGRIHHVENVYSRVNSSLSKDIIVLHDGSLEFESHIWQQRLTGRFENSVIADFLNAVKRWLQKLQEVSIDIVRWFCHGHIGLCLLFNFYGACIREACRNSARNAEEEYRSLQIDDKHKVALIASIWARRALANESVYPVELFQLLLVST